MQSPDAVVVGRVGFDLYATEPHTPLSRAATFTRCLGGSAANIAVGLARLGLPVGLISRVSDDDIGTYLLEFLEVERVDIRFVRRTPGARSSLALVEVSPPDAFPTIFYREDCADSRLAPPDIDERYVASARLCLVGGTSLATSPSREAVHRALELARAHCVLTMLDVDFRPQLWANRAAATTALRAVLPLVDVLIGNDEEIALLVETTGPPTHSMLRSLGPRLVLAKHGARGASEVTSDDAVEVPAFPVPVVCGLGAGDAFAAGWIASYLRGAPARQRLRYGAACGGIVATRLSCAQAMPTRKEVAQFLADRCGDRTIALDFLPSSAKSHGSLPHRTSHDTST
jgi:5-dehydro-2-deoxygluconokinase